VESYEKRVIFAPFFLYSPTLLKTLDRSKKLQTWLSLHTNRSTIKSQALCDLWKDYIFANLSDFNLLRCSYTIKDVATILSTFKDVIKDLAIGLFAESEPKNLVGILKSFLSGNKVLESLNISANELESKDIIEILKPVKDVGCLKQLNVSDNLINADGIRYIADLLMENGLDSLSIGNNPYDSGSIEYLENIIKRKWARSQYGIYTPKPGDYEKYYLFVLHRRF